MVPRRFTSSGDPHPKFNSSEEGRTLTVPIAIVSASNLVNHDEVLAATAALQIQVHRDFAPAWNVDADLTVIVPGDAPPPDAWWVVIVDDSDIGNALGYHDLTSSGLPIGKVFVENARKADQVWTVLFSHEILEMLADPFIYLSAVVPSAIGIWLYAYENCDACQSDEFGYKIGDQLLSDFCFPAWFNANKFGDNGPFDFGRHIKQPFQLLPNGYAMRRNLSFGAGWMLITSGDAPLPYSERPRLGSRRERRNTGFPNWIKSLVKTGSNFEDAEFIRPRI